MQIKRLQNKVSHYNKLENTLDEIIDMNNFLIQEYDIELSNEVIKSTQTIENDLEINQKANIDIKSTITVGYEEKMIQKNFNTYI